MLKPTSSIKPQTIGSYNLLTKVRSIYICILSPVILCYSPFNEASSFLIDIDLIRSLFISSYSTVLSDLTPPPLVFSISYGWAELEQCDIAATNCGKFGYNSQQYVTRTNSEFAKLG